MEKKFILRGLLAGAVGGLLAFVFARIFAESQIQRAIDYESGRDEAQEALDKAAGMSLGEHGHELYSRTLQGNLGIGVGMVVFGLAMGALFAVVYTICLGRVGRIRARNLSLLVAAGGFLGFYLVPFLKYPANPPAIGHEETIKARSLLYIIMVVGSILFLCLAVVLGRALSARYGNWTASLIAGGAFVISIAILMLILPSVGELAFNRNNYGKFATETPEPLKDPAGNIVYPGFPADVLTNFRLYSVGAQVIMLTTIGLIFGPLAERVLNRARSSTTLDPSPVPAHS
ncbi:MAG: cobalt transporter [Pseudonocardiales bacterium]|nr:cobalt transporter [Pseudonocardiales bacterium]